MCQSYALPATILQMNSKWIFPFIELNIVDICGMSGIEHNVDTVIMENTISKIRTTMKQSN